MYRRELLRRSALAAASIAILSCAPAATGPTASASLKPAKGGTITWGQWDKIDVIDPALTTGAAAGEIAQNILDTLITMDSDQKFYPALASKWTITDSAKTFTFTLRDGVKFHDGSTLSSAAVKGSFDRILDPKTKAGAVVSLYQIPTDARLNHRVEIVGGVCADECADGLRAFFAALRKGPAYEA